VVIYILDFLSIIGDLDLSREALLAEIKTKNSYYFDQLGNAEKAIGNWENYGGFEKVRDLLLEKMFTPGTFKWKFSTDAAVLNSTVDRYYLLNFLIEERILDGQNIKGTIIDIGCHVGATTDALAMYGGDVRGTDRGKYAYSSPSGRSISGQEGISMVKSYNVLKLRDNPKPSLIACFNVDWVEEMSHNRFAIELCQESLNTLGNGGQVLYTFSRKTGLEDYSELEVLQNSQIIELPKGLNKREKYAFVASKV
jgi:hypothetical protein